MTLDSQKLSVALDSGICGCFDFCYKNRFMFSSKTLKFEQNLWGSFKCMITVIYALFLRETYTLYGESRFGYVWVLLRDIFSIGLLVVFKFFFKNPDWQGMDTLHFFLLGLVLYYIFSECVTKCIAARAGNKAILAFPQVTVVDTMISRCLLVFLTNIQAAFVISFVAHLFGLELIISNYGLFFYCLGMTTVMGFTVGLFLASVSDFYPVVGKIWNMFKFMLMFLSGIIFPLTRFPIPSDILEILYLNPLFQLVEGFRESASCKYYLISHVDITYLNMWMVVTLIIGLLLDQSTKFERN
jgi:capsular polysaccharide transport system permease protein